MASFPKLNDGYYDESTPGYATVGYSTSYATTMHQPVYYTNALTTWELSKPVEEPKAEPVVGPGAGWLDGELDAVMSLGRAEPVLA